MPSIELSSYSLRIRTALVALAGGAAALPARRHVAEVERRGTRAAQAGALLHDLFEHLHVAVQVVALAKRKTRADERFAQPNALGHAQPPIVDERAAALSGIEKIVARRV